MAISKRFASENYVNENLEIAKTEINEEITSLSEEIVDLSWSDLGEKQGFGDTLTWDGNTEGLVHVSLFDELDMYLISDVLPTKNDCADGLSYIAFGELGTNTGEEIQSFFTEDDFLFMEVWAIVPTDNYVFELDGDTTTFPKKGIYFYYASSEECVSSLTINGYNGFPTTVTKKVPNKYLDILETVGSDTLTWDGNTDEFEGFDILGAGEPTHYLISTSVPNSVTNYSITIYGAGDGGEDLVLTHNEMPVENSDGVIIVAEAFAIIVPEELVGVEIDGLAFSKSGVYLACFDGMYIKSLTISGYNGFNKKTLLKKEYIPNHEHSWSDLGDKNTLRNTLTWDGADSDIIVSETYHYISTDTPTAEQLIGAEAYFFDGTSEVKVGDVTTELIVSDNNFLSINETIIVTYTDNVVMPSGVTFPKKGIYFIKSDGQYVTKIVANSNIFGEIIIEPLDNKYLNILDITKSDTLTWDGKPTKYFVETLSLYLVSYSTPSLEELLGATVSIVGSDGVTNIIVGDENQDPPEYFDDNKALGTEAGIFVAYEDNASSGAHVFPKKGTYFIGSDDGSYYVSNVVATSEIFVEEQLKEEYVPDTMATKEYVDSLFSSIAEIKSYLGIE